jgi:hypothetical protein
MKKILTQYGVVRACGRSDGDVGATQTQTPGLFEWLAEMMVVQQGRFTMGAPAGANFAEAW